MIDHTLLSATATLSDIEAHCAEAVEYGFCTVCVPGRWVLVAADILKETPIKIDAVAGFPFGSDTTAAKIADAKEMIAAGVSRLGASASVQIVNQFAGIGQ